MTNGSIRVGTAALALLACACTGASPPSAGTPGGYATVSTTDTAVAAAAAFAVEAQRQALGAGGNAASLELVRILGAEQQVVAGMNYRLALRVRHDGAERTAEAVVWWQAWRTPDPYQLTSWQWR